MHRRGRVDAFSVIFSSHFFRFTSSIIIILLLSASSASHSHRHRRRHWDGRNVQCMSMSIALRAKKMPTRHSKVVHANKKFVFIASLRHTLEHSSRTHTHNQPTAMCSNHSNTSYGDQTAVSAPPSLLLCCCTVTFAPVKNKM